MRALGEVFLSRGQREEVKMGKQPLSYPKEMVRFVTFLQHPPT